jgi:release factor glutamine methyltransferase
MTQSTNIAPGATIRAVQASLPLEPLENRILLQHALGLSRVGLITQSERALTQDEATRLATLVRRRLDGEPIAYIIGRREFFGLDFEVNPAVLIPRPDTELIVELAIERLAPQGRLLDMGTGSGAIAVAAAHTRKDARVTALDVSEAALAVARANAAGNGANVRFLRSDWFSAVGDERFEVIASNPPYIAAGDEHLSQGDLRFEPVGALTDHADGLSALRIIVGRAHTWSRADGCCSNMGTTRRPRCARCSMRIAIPRCRAGVTWLASSGSVADGSPNSRIAFGSRPEPPTLRGATCPFDRMAGPPERSHACVDCSPSSPCLPPWLQAPRTARPTRRARCSTVTGNGACSSSPNSRPRSATTATTRGSRTPRLPPCASPPPTKSACSTQSATSTAAS